MSFYCALILYIQDTKNYNINYRKIKGNLVKCNIFKQLVTCLKLF